MNRQAHRYARNGALAALGLYTIVILVVTALTAGFDAPAVLQWTMSTATGSSSDSTRRCPSRCKVSRPPSLPTPDCTSLARLARLANTQILQNDSRPIR